MTNHITQITRFLSDYAKKKDYVEPPYHNLRHIHGMHAIAVSLLDGYKHTEEDRYVLDHACLFHDLGHSGGELSDADNIKIAVKLFLNYAAALNSKVAIKKETSEKIVKAITCTEFPFIHTPTTVVECCIRDADVLYATLHSDPSVVLKDLRSEINLTRINKGLQAITVGEMVRGQYEFMQFIEMYTPAGDKLLKQNLDTYLAKLDAYL